MKVNHNLKTMEGLTSYMERLIQGRALMVFGEIETVVELSYGANPPRVHENLSPTRLPFRDLYFDTVAVHLPPQYPKELGRDCMAEVSRMAKKRIVFLGDFIPIDEQKRFLTHAAFRLTEKIVIQAADGVGVTAILSVFDF